MSKFPKTLAAFRKREEHFQEFRDAILEACNTRLEHGALVTLADLSDYLKEEGFDLSVTRLAQIRRGDFRGLRQRF